jgi:hypothetical protein
MISYDLAKQKALELNSDVNTCYEFNNAYRFLDKNDDSDGDKSVIILKKDGKALNYVNYILDYATSNEMKEIKF